MRILNECLSKRFNLNEKLVNSDILNSYFDKYTYYLTNSTDKYDAQAYFIDVQDFLDTTINLDLTYFKLSVCIKTENSYDLCILSEDNIIVEDNNFSVMEILSPDFLDNNISNAFDEDAFKQDYKTIYNKLISEVYKINKVLPNIADDWGFVLVKKADESDMRYKPIVEDMSPEDEADSKLIRSVINKTLNRANAKLTPEEKDILTKYGLERIGNDVHINEPFSYKHSNLNRGIGNTRKTDYSKPNYWMHRPKPIDVDKINYPDLIRKRKERDNVYKASTDELDSVRQERNQLENAIWSRNFHKKFVDGAESTLQADLDAAEEAFNKAVKAAQDKYENATTYHKDSLDKALNRIQSILDKHRK